MKTKNFVSSGMLGLWLTVAVAVSPAILVAGCPAVGVQVPNTFNERVVAGYKTVEATADSVGILLTARKISAADAANAHTSLTTFKEGIDVAVQIHEAGDFTSADSRLQATILGLTAIQTYLRSKQ